MIKKMFILDTDLLIDLLRGHPEAKEFFNKIKKREYLAHFSTMLETEIFAGKSAATPEDQHIINGILELMTRIPVDKKVARKAGELKRKYGCGIPDAIMAATALTQRIQTVATRNRKYFTMIKGIKVFTPY
jgi:predicted nucleic acid-binding protein